MSIPPFGTPTERHRNDPLPRTPGDGRNGAADGSFGAGVRDALLIVGALLAVAAVAALDRMTFQRFSFSLFYLMPVAACAWWRGFACGVLLSLAGAAAWHAVDLDAGLSAPPAVLAWNGVVRFCVLTLVSSLVARLHAGVRRERALARTDPLTGAANGRTFYEAAAAEASRAGRAGRPLTLAYLDLDDFKPLNDRLGHAAGDAALVCVVQTAQLHLRCSDLLARLGGDEFALLLPETDAEGAAAVLGRVRESLAREMGRRGWAVTVSVGAATFLEPARDVDLMVRRVDALMYAAKRGGKGRIEHAVVRGDSGSPPCERRATARPLFQQKAKIWREGHESEQAEFATVQYVSESEIGLHLDKALPPDTLLVVEPLSRNARTLLARVLRASPEGAGWNHGCELSTPLDAEEFRGWLENRPQTHDGSDSFTPLVQPEPNAGGAGRAAV